jgi:CheY-like chemotaxis protein
MVQVSVSTALGRRILDRWRTQGFDLVNQYPSGFCSPISSRSVGATTPEGYSFHPIDSPEAIRAIAGAIERGASYTYRELGTVEPISVETLGMLRDLRILFVDDRSDTRDLVDTILETCGASVRTVDSAEAALDALERESFDLLVSDIMMPGSDGFELMRRLRARTPARGGHIPAIALTALDEDEYRDRALEAGYQLYLIKPVAPARLVEAAASLAA